MSKNAGIGIFGLMVLVIAITFWIIQNPNTAVQTGEHIAESVENISPDAINATQTICNLEEIVISKINTSAITESMLNWSSDQANEILEKWDSTDKVEICEVVMLNEVLSHSGFENTWRNKIGLKNAMKNQVCTIIECFDKYGAIEYLEKQKEG